MSGLLAIRRHRQGVSLSLVNGAAKPLGNLRNRCGQMITARADSFSGKNEYQIPEMMKAWVGWARGAIADREAGAAAGSGRGARAGRRDSGVRDRHRDHPPWRA